MAKGSDDFNVNKLNGGGSLPSYIDGSDAEATAGRIITFYHINSDHYVAFKAFITAFNETYSSDWASEQVYGRNDPIYMFKNTTRKITLSFKVPAATVGESYENLGRVQKLLQFLYPNYSGLRPRDYTPSTESWNDVEGMAHANTISGAPLVRLQVMNLARRRDPGEWDEFTDDWTNAQLNREMRQASIAQTLASVEHGRSTFRAPTVHGNLRPQVSRMPEEGLLGAIGSVNVNHNLEGEDGVFEQMNGAVLPKMIEIAIDFSPIHESHLGWFEDGTFGSDAFPYGSYGPSTQYYKPTQFKTAEADQKGVAPADENPDDSLAPDASAGDADMPADSEPENETEVSDSAAANEAAEFGGTGAEWGARLTALLLQHKAAISEAQGGSAQLTGEQQQQARDAAHAELEREKAAFRGGHEDWRDR